MCASSPFMSLCLVVFFAAAGCGRGPGLPTVPVTGTVRYKGQPVAGAQISFLPVDASGKPATAGKPATGVTDAQGRFTARTPVGGATFADGALTGDYIVLVTRAPAINKGASVMSVDEWSKLSEEERAAKRGALKTRRPGDTPADADKSVALESELPLKYADAKAPKLRRSVKAEGANEFTFDLED